MTTTYIDILLAFAGFFLGAAHWFAIDVPMCTACFGHGYSVERVSLHGDQTGRGTEIRRVCFKCAGERWNENDSRIVWRP